MASEIRVDKINSLSGVGTVTLSPTGVDIAGITTAATLRATTGIVTSLTAGSLTSLGAVSGTTGTFSGAVSGTTGTFSAAVSGTTGTFTGDVDIADKIVHTGDTDTAIRFPTNDIITAETAGSERLRITNDGKIGFYASSPVNRFQIGNATFNGGHGMYTNDRVGLSNHGSLTGLMLASTYNDAGVPEYGIVFVQGPDTSNYNVWSISPDGPAKGNSLSLHYGAQNTNIHILSNRKFEFDGDGDFRLTAGNIDIPNGYGIDFSAVSGSASGAANQILDDYEEGSWTPSSNATLTSAAGRYTKIGRQVTIHCRVVVDTNSSGNQMNITGMPYTPTMNSSLSNGSTPSGFGYISGSVITGGIQIHTNYSTNQLHFYNFATALTQATFSGRELRFGVVYYVGD